MYRSLKRNKLGPLKAESVMRLGLYRVRACDRTKGALKNRAWMERSIQLKVSGR